MEGNKGLSHARDILVCVTGLTPQIVTETLYALAVGGPVEQRRLPTEIHVVTTGEGRRRIEHTLLDRPGGVPGQFQRLCADYGLDRGAIRFGPETLHVIRDRQGRELDDITDPDGNAAVADCINALLRQLTHDPQLRLHVSLAGGRKTMGFYAGYALSLYARPQDELSHVLVNTPFESHPEFFYPPPQPRRLKVAHTGETVSTAHAEVRLARLPFVRLRDGLDPALLDGEIPFSTAVERAQQSLDRPELRIDLTRRRVYLQGHEVRLSSTHFIWLVWFAERAHHDLPPIPFDENAAKDLLRLIEYLEGHGITPIHEAVASAALELQQGQRSNYFERTRSRLNRALSERSGLTPRAAERYHIKASGRRPHTGYALDLPPQSIHIEGEP
ncbi:CRISPR-associated ring nuclease Csm6 [Nitrococcus mobilis]|uniref:CRISPR system ring nuclease SSO2081-like domain-containing protein n=1 Tax=Nitrococcus mobilis Nb-231 TaxID=314278 RepID=A4BL68_9GAMM|nr:CRISPR-associated ring nuclease Csm6 [Nitrococcus mobilis]EAR23056.1 hypothetical protein NB231_14588 [Nitrococcus mobilis Nb-231]